MSISSIASQATQALGAVHPHAHHAKPSASGAPASGGGIIDQIASQLTGGGPAAAGAATAGTKTPSVGSSLTQLSSDLLNTLSGLLSGTGPQGASSSSGSGQAASAYAASSALGT